MAISVENLFFSYNEEPILKQEALNIQEGSFLGIIGPNGGGKTTFLKLLMGFLKPSQGSIQILGTTPEKAREKIGYVPQVHKCDRDFPITVRELVLLGALDKKSLFGSYPKAIRDKADFLMDTLGLLPHAKKTFGSLSGGLAQRALLARALLCEPKLLLLDEPTANVDPVSTKAIIDNLSLYKGKNTVLIVTHDFQTIEETVDQVLCVQGQITTYQPEHVCKHMSRGIYHSPKESAHV